MTEHEKHWRWATPPVNGVTPPVNGAARMGGEAALPVNGAARTGGGATPSANGAAQTDGGASLSANGVARMGDGAAPPVNGVARTDGGRVLSANGAAPMGDGTALPIDGVARTGGRVTPPVNGAARTDVGGALSANGAARMGDAAAFPVNGAARTRRGAAFPGDGAACTGEGSAHALGGVEVLPAAGSSPKQDNSRHSLLPPVLTARARWKAALNDRLPPTLHGRWAIDRTTGIVLAVSVLLGALLIGGWAVLRARPHEMAVARDRPLGSGGGGEGGSYPHAAPADSPQVDSLPTVPVSLSPNAGSGVGTGSDAGTGTGSVIVDVEGKVAKPGVRTLPAGSRILDALNAAGGALPGTDLTSLNQAQVLVDGEQVLVGVAPPPQGDAGSVGGHGGKGKKGHGSGGPGSVEPVHLNTATVDDLEGLPGVGPALAQRVIDYRSQHGPFHSVDELRQVSGFGGQRYENLASMIAL
jgi:competence protein ComEA